MRSIAVAYIALLILSHFFLNIQWKWNKLVNYLIFIGYLKAGEGGGGRASPLNPLWIRH